MNEDQALPDIQRFQDLLYFVQAVIRLFMEADISLQKE
jgi:hypothetical protein